MNDTPIVYVVDDDPSHLAAMRRVLCAAGFEAQAFSSGAQLISALSSVKACGCVVADLDMPGLNGLELQAALSRSQAPLPVVFLTGRGDIPSTVTAMRHGAVDFLEKRVPVAQIIAAVTRAFECDAATRRASARREAVRQRFATLTRRELEVLRCVVRGRMNKQIAAELGIHERTVKLHRTAITRKLGVPSVAGLTALTHEAGLFESD